ncbi:MAG: hypothetical protein Q9226_002379 [Calogaya cf. arnoldii]
MVIDSRVYTFDVTDTDALRNALARMKGEMPPSKGVIHGAMVLRDGLFETISYESWSGATGTKIQGSWNLHSLIPYDLDFFIMLSSLAGILGNRDGLAHYRRSLNLPAQVINLGAVAGLGWFKENKESLRFGETMQNLIIREEEFYTLIKYAITGYSQGEHSVPTQLITGVGSGGLIKANRAAGGQSDYYWLHESPRISYLRQLDIHGTLQASSGDDGVDALKSSLTAVTTLAQATSLIQNTVAANLAKAIMIGIDEINVDRAVASYRVDSLVAAEMRNWYFRDLKADISVFELLSGNAIAVLAERIAGKSALIRSFAEEETEEGVQD